MNSSTLLWYRRHSPHWNLNKSRDMCIVCVWEVTWCLDWIREHHSTRARAYSIDQHGCDVNDAVKYRRRSWWLSKRGERVDLLSDWSFYPWCTNRTYRHEQNHPIANVHFSRVHSNDRVSLLRRDTSDRWRHILRSLCSIEERFRGVVDDSAYPNAKRKNAVNSSWIRELVWFYWLLLLTRFNMSELKSRLPRPICGIFSLWIEVKWRLRCSIW